MEKMRCVRCQSEAVMPDTGYCFKCKFHNKPLVNPEEEARKKRAQQAAEQEAVKQAAREAIRRELQAVLEAARSGDLPGATKRLQGINPPETDLRIEKMKVQAELWRLKDVPDMQLKVLEELATELPFDQKTLEFYYEMACLYQEGGSDAKAFTILNRFVENSYDWFKEDILTRWQQLKGKGTTPSHGPYRGSCRIMVGAMDRTVESVRAWIDRATADQRCFTESILLNDSSFKDIERVERSFSSAFELKSVVSGHNRRLQESGYIHYQSEQGQIALEQEGVSGGSEAEVLVIRPTGNGPLVLEFGTINLAAQFMPEGRSAVSLAFYEFFTPRSPQDFPGQQPDLRDFNDKIYKTVSLIQQNNTERTVLLRSHRELIVKSVTAFLEQQDRADGDLLF